MTQLVNTKIILYHLYPGIIIMLSMMLLIPVGIHYGFPPQFGMLLSIIIVAVPLLIVHLTKAKEIENKASITELNGFTNKLSRGKLFLYTIILLIFAFTIWGLTQPLDNLITQNFFQWLPSWIIKPGFDGYSKDKILITLVINLLVNGLLAPYVEELYFRGYLLPRMKNWGKYAFVVNATLFSLYHFWQANIYITLIITLLPMTYMVWKTKDIRLAILTHSLLNLIGALLLFALLNKDS